LFFLLFFLSILLEVFCFIFLVIFLVSIFCTLKKNISLLFLFSCYFKWVLNNFGGV
jgi:hypothetical protein